MKKGLSVTSDYDDAGFYAVTVEKKRGKLTLDDIVDAIRSSGSDLFGLYALVLNLNEWALEGPGNLFDEPPGDSQVLYRIDDGETCPVCHKMTPVLTYCPHCGEKLSVTALDMPAKEQEDNHAQLT